MRTPGHALLALVMLALAVALATGCSPGGTPPGGGTGGGPSGETTTAPGRVSMSDFAFVPANIEVRTGTAVTWTNDDSTQHTVVSDTGAFSSDTIEPGGTYSFTFSETGTFPYHCSIHPSMVGQVVVK